MKPIRIQLVDDRALLKGALCSLLNDVPDFEILKPLRFTEHHRQDCMHNRPDVLITGITFNGKCSLECVRTTMGRMPSANILIVSMQSNETNPRHALDVGAKGYITMNASPRELISAVREVSAGRTFIEPAVAQRMMTSHVANTKNPFDVLTRREYEVLLMLLDDRSTDEISSKLHLSKNTIANYHTEILQKLEIHSNVKLTKLAIRHGIIDL